MPFKPLTTSLTGAPTIKPTPGFKPLPVSQISRPTPGFKPLATPGFKPPAPSPATIGMPTIPKVSTEPPNLEWTQPGAPPEPIIRAPIPGEISRPLTPQENAELSILQEAKYLREKAPVEKKIEAFTTAFSKYSPSGYISRTILGNKIIPDDKALQQAFPVEHFVGNFAGNLYSTVSAIKLLNPYLAGIATTISKSIPMF